MVYSFGLRYNDRIEYENEIVDSEFNSGSERFCGNSISSADGFCDCRRGCTGDDLLLFDWWEE